MKVYHSALVWRGEHNLPSDKRDWGGRGRPSDPPTFCSLPQWLNTMEMFSSNLIGFQYWWFNQCHVTKIPIVETNSVLLKQISHDIKEVGNLFYVTLYADSDQLSNCDYECVGASYQSWDWNIIEVTVSDSLLEDGLYCEIERIVCRQHAVFRHYLFHGCHSAVQILGYITAS